MNSAAAPVDWPTAAWPSLARRSAPGARAFGFVPRASGFVPRASGFVPRASGFVPRASGFVPRASGFVPRASGFVSVSWPGLARPPTTLFAALAQDVGGRAKPGHDTTTDAKSGRLGHDTTTDAKPSWPGHDTTTDAKSGRLGHDTTTDAKPSWPGHDATTDAKPSWPDHDATTNAKPGPPCRDTATETTLNGPGHDTEAAERNTATDEPATECAIIRPMPPAMTAATDLAHMRAALALARRGLGSTWPNPSVGCVIVRDGRVIGRGTTAPGGRPHAEPIALAMAGELAKGATVYVTLEPCCHWGRSPPCTDAMIAAGVARVVVAATDPDPRVNGQGLAKLQAAGVEIQTGLLEAAAAETLIGFHHRVTLGRPMVTLKLASTLDGRIATHSGESQWITDTPARRLGHAMRGRHDAVMVGVGTVLADNPDLTCRIPGFRPIPNVRIVADSHLRTPLTSHLMATAAETPTWFLLREGTNLAREDAFTDIGAKLIKVPGSSAGIDLVAAMQALGNAGLTRVMVEGGGQLAAALLRADLVDRIAWFHAPAVMGGDGWPAVQAFRRRDP